MTPFFSESVVHFHDRHIKKLAPPFSDDKGNLGTTLAQQRMVSLVAGTILCIQANDCVAFEYNCSESCCITYRIVKARKGTTIAVTPSPTTELYSHMALKGGWKTTAIRQTYKILSLAWGPSSVNYFYALTTKWSHYMVKMLTLKGRSLKNTAPWHIITLPFLNIEWSTIDTGMCMTNDDLSCIYIFGKVKRGSTYVMYLRSYRDVKNPRRLVLEREKEITKNIPATVLSCIFACNGKFGMGVYLRQGDSGAVQKYSIDVGEGALVLDGRMDVKGLVQMPKIIKWNSDGTVAFALCEKTFYIIIRCCNDKEQVDMEVKHKWIGWYALYWTSTSIEVYDAQNGGTLAVFLSLKFT
ncbi:uncharacterized protein [Haliotis cracherodii]|uniref:uncharacterized protein n=1 Tax=Haliotis cracherodii TaxID=6455 RepID=UPI0039EA7EBE